MNSWQTALFDCLKLLPPPHLEQVSSREADGRLLMQLITADRDYPHGDLSQMDGYAIQDGSGPGYRIEGENRPGRGPGKSLESGTARRIFTGAELPARATRVVPQELTTRQGDHLHITDIPESTFVRRRGCEAHLDAPLLFPGTRLGPIETALLAAVGVTHLEVSARPRIAHLMTGDEIVPFSEPLPRGLVRDSNSPLIAALLRQTGHTLVEHRRVGDDRASMIQIMGEMTSNCDLLLISGGASVGDHDHTRPALEANGFHFEKHGVDVRPGKPVGFARRENQWAIALPGNPVSHLVAFHLFVLPLLRGLEGEKQVEPQLSGGILQENLATESPRRPTFWPSTVTMKEGHFQLQPRRFLSSGDLIGIAGTNALLFLPSGQAIPQMGESVLFLPLT